ncbi:MAG: DUF4965 domain-containing protein [Clostridia bacterium]|nr:DUF4965 domain-containing protein [Clostridia bacterium]
MNFRPTAIPLVTIDPYFSIWSFSDCLTDDHTRHWTGQRNTMYGVLYVDGKPYRFMGKTDARDKYCPEGPALEQVSVEVRPTTTVYTFAHPACELRLSFVTPLLMDRLEVLSRPVSYIFYEITPREEGHTFQVHLDFSSEITGDLKGQSFVAKKTDGHAWIGAQEQRVLNRSGDDVRIDWGYLHLVHPNADVARMISHYGIFGACYFASDVNTDQPIPCDRMPVLVVKSQELSDCFVIAYDDIHSIEYFHKPVDAYYKKFYSDFESMLKVAVREANELRTACDAFDADLIAKMEKITPEYAKIGALVYRQAIAAHKAVDVDGELMFFSKENFSGGCMATLDVTYPSIPLFLLYNPELVRGMMRPLLAYAKSELWPYRYAPHDCGLYPLCNGQFYSTHDWKLAEDRQMPIEECGNAILVVAAALKADGDRSLIDANRDLLKQWADYLVEFGYDPENQLCTDDFAGHLAHNCNLSLKAIVALGAYATFFGETQYAEIAKDMASRWVKDAKKKSAKGWKLTFDQDDTWSMKYNIIWDRLLGLELFDASVSEEEMEVYGEKMNRYGVPLDSRSDYTKLDWMAWTTVMADQPEYTKRVYKSIAAMICDTPERVPVTDWYFTSTAHMRGFQARSVLGGFFINLLADRFLENS